MPHCWPQKQQCVFTRDSGSTLVESRSGRAGDRWGPNVSINFAGSVGRVAMEGGSRAGRGTGGQVLLPERALRQPEERPAAARANLLVVLRALVTGELVGEA